MSLGTGAVGGKVGQWKLNDPHFIKLSSKSIDESPVAFLRGTVNSAYIFGVLYTVPVSLLLRKGEEIPVKFCMERLWQ